jgi:uncharacterized protein
MKRTKDPHVNLSRRIHNLSTLLARSQLMSRLGMQYDNSRDLYQALGYKTDLVYSDFAAFYERHDMAKAVINRPVEATWRGEFGIVESDDENETKLEKAWGELCGKIPVKQIFQRLDKLASIGSYGVLVMGLNDVTQASGLKNPVGGGGKELLYLKPFSEGSAKISTYETNPTSPRYGLPIVYEITITNPGTQSNSIILVHYSRVIHVTGELLESEYEGVPVLQAVYNRLMDLEKLVGGSAEMFWRGARPGYQGKIDPEYQMTSETEADLKDQINEYEHNLRRILVNSGIDLTALATQVADPKTHVDVQLQMISAVTGIPKRILTGSELGELSSSEDKNNWLSLIDSRRSEYAEPQIVRQFVDRCIEYKILPPPKIEYSVRWEDLFAQSDKDKAEVGRCRAEALRAYTMSPTAESVVPPDAFYQFFLGLDEDEIELIKEIKEAAIDEEQRAIAAGEIPDPMEERRALVEGAPKEDDEDELGD